MKACTGFRPILFLMNITSAAQAAETMVREVLKTIEEYLYERCSLAGKDGDCARSRPALLEAEPDHLVACRLSGSQ